MQAVVDQMDQQKAGMPAVDPVSDCTIHMTAPHRAPPTASPPAAAASPAACPPSA